MAGALAASRAALACPSCFQAVGRERIAYYATTAFLTLLPMALFGGFVLWVYRSLRRPPGAPTGER